MRKNVVAQFAELTSLTDELSTHPGVRLYQAACNQFGKHIENACLGNLPHDDEFQMLVDAINQTLKRDKSFSAEQLREAMIAKELPGSTQIEIVDGEMRFRRGVCVMICDLFLVAGQISTPADEQTAILNIGDPKKMADAVNTMFRQTQ